MSCVTELRSGEYLSNCLLRSLCAPVSVVLGCSPFFSSLPCPPLEVQTNIVLLKQG